MAGLSHFSNSNFGSPSASHYGRPLAFMPPATFRRTQLAPVPSRSFQDLTLQSKGAIFPTSSSQGDRPMRESLGHSVGPQKFSSLSLINSYLGSDFDSLDSDDEVDSFDPGFPNDPDLEEPPVHSPFEGGVAHESDEEPTAPGGDKELFKAGYVKLSGTSMAAPHVAAVVADCKAINPKLNCEQMRCILINSAVSGVVPRLNHLGAMLLAEKSLTTPIECPSKPEPSINLDETPDPPGFSLELDIRPTVIRCKNRDSAQEIRSVLANSDDMVVETKGAEVMIQPRRVMVKVDSELAGMSDEKMTRFVNARMQATDPGSAPTLQIVGRISPSIAIATVSVPGNSARVSIREEGAAAVKVIDQGHALESVCAALTDCPGIAAIEPDEIFPGIHDLRKEGDFFDVTDLLNLKDPLRLEQWALNKLDDKGIGTDAAKAYREVKGLPTPREAGIHIGVGDTGSGPHPDMEDVFLPGRRFIDGDYSSPDSFDRTRDVSHGVHVAGTMAALTGNNIGIEGVTDAKVLPAKVLSDLGSGSLIDIIVGIRWMAGLDIDGHNYPQEAASVINLSLGYQDRCSGFLQETLTEASDKGVITVVAAGNSNIDAGYDCPANCRDVITVGAHDSKGEEASFSNFGKLVDIYAPGVSVLATTVRKVDNVDTEELQEPANKWWL